MRQYRIKQTAAAAAPPPPPPSSPGLSIAKTANHRRPAEPPSAEERHSKRRRTAATIGIGIAGGASATTAATTGDGGGGGGGGARSNSRRNGSGNKDNTGRGISISGTAAHEQPERRTHHQGARKQAPAKHGGAPEDDNTNVSRRRSVFGYRMQQALRSRMGDAASAAAAGGTPLQRNSSGNDSASLQNQPGAGIAIAKTAKAPRVKSPEPSRPS
ncbi:hypothetical protein IWW48_003839 [Coemansia sp. RSA 1200]|nr:hypothetical protein IWW48_003839 [Coemansia sp. RSA 1200]